MAVEIFIITPRFPFTQLMECKETNKRTFFMVLVKSQQNRVASNGERHGIINIVANSVSDNEFKHMTPENKTKAEKLKKEEQKIVKVRYHNYQGTHERLTFPYMRWAGEQICTWHLIPGEEYEVPYGMVKQVNDPAKRKPKRSDLLDHNGIPMPKDATPEIIHELFLIN